MDQGVQNGKAETTLTTTRTLSQQIITKSIHYDTGTRRNNIRRHIRNNPYIITTTK